MTEGAATGHRRRTLLLAAALVVVLAAAVVGYRWWTSPTVFEGSGSSFRGDPVPLRRAALSTTVVYPDEDRGTLTLRGAEPHLPVDTARSDVSFVVCDVGPSGVLGAGRGPLAPYCSEPQTFGNGDEAMLTRDQIVLMTITPTRPGRTTVQAVTFDYVTGRDHLWRRGEQRVRVGLTTQAR